jgi:hypothetical protein
MSNIQNLHSFDDAKLSIEETQCSITPEQTISTLISQQQSSIQPSHPANSSTYETISTVPSQDITWNKLII